MYRARIAAALSLLGGVVLATSCADRTVGPDEMIAPFAISESQRANLAAALRFAMREDALSPLADRDAAARISIAAAELAQRVDANDRRGALQAIHAVRSDLRSSREGAGSDAAALLVIEALSLALDHAEMLAAIVPADVYVSDEESD